MKECPACHRCFPDHLNHCPSDGDALKFSIPGEPVLDGRYQLERKLGQGGMGMVFKARHVFLKTAHAVKVILPDLVGNDPSLVTRFRQEAMAAAAIRHPNTINVTDYGIINGTTPFLVMEFCEGGSLHDILTAEGRLPPRRAVELMLAVCAGVSAAHKLGIVHRDLKPLNILVRADLPPQEGVKVLDFGLAKIKSGELLGSFVAAQTQGMMGSPFYMAPEQWSDEDLDVRADIYSLGIILYQMLAGEVPFRGPSVPAIMKKHLTSAPMPLRERGLAVPDAVERAVTHALEKEPSARPQTVEEFAAELRAALSSLNGADASEAAPTILLTPEKTLRQAPVWGAPTPPAGGVNTVADAGAPGEGAETPGRATTPPAAPSGDTPPAAERPGAITEAAPPQAERTSPVQHTVPDAGRTTPPADPAPEQDEEVTHIREVAARAPESHAPVADVAAAFAPPPASRAPLVIVGAVVVLALIGAAAALGFYLLRGSGAGGAGSVNATAEANTSASTNTNVAPVENKKAEAPRPELIALPGGQFRVGRDDVPPLTDEARATRPGYLLWMYNQWPAHAVSVAPFHIDRTEVTNAEYAAFVGETGHPAPPEVWDGDRPREGQEQLPVVNVSYADAAAFAAWRSRRDGVAYRLPTEQEWEYAARGGDASRLYPWGGSGAAADAANLGGEGLRPVGSFPSGATPQGVLDMLGNAWEWTSSEARMYPGNTRTTLSAADRGKVVVRGGSYANRADGDEPVAATARRWVAKEFRSPQLGFRLVRDAR